MPLPSPRAAAPAPPTHIAIIMDGNGRWAKAKGLPRAIGHQRGAEAARAVGRGCRGLGGSYLPLVAFSSENWKRPAAEVGDLMNLLRLYIRAELNDLNRNGVRIRIIGARDRLPDDILGLIEEAEGLTQANQALTLAVALDYGGQNEILNACRKIAAEAKAGKLQIGAIDETLFRKYLSTADIPDPDLVIRTSGEQRLSNFLLWQAAYAELIFTETLWPDFRQENLMEAVDEFRRRERRYGAGTV